MKFLENGLSQDHEIIQASGTVFPTNVPEMTSLAASGRHESKFEEWPKMLHPTALSRISQEHFKRGSPNFAPSLGTVSPKTLPDMTSLAVSFWLQNTIKYCTKVRKRDAVGRVE